MKTIPSITTTFLTLAISAGTLLAKPIPGPKGGRILTADAPHAEFFVEKDRKVVVSFYDQALKPLAPSGQTVIAIAEAKGGKKTLEFTEQNGALVSKTALPEGDEYTVVVQIRETANARPKNYRVLFQDEICEECKRAEYACTCDDTGHKHEHEKKKN